MTRAPRVEFALERWFASVRRPPAIDLSASGAPARSLAELLALATDDERRAFASTTLGYGPPAGSRALRTSIAATLGAAPDDVLVTCGAIEALHVAVASLVRPGDEVVVQDPMYPAVADLALARGARVARWTLDPADDYRPRLERLAALLTPRTRLVAITQPNGPAGSVLEREALAALVDLLSPRGAWLLSDEVYRDVSLEPGLAVPSAFGSYERAVVVGDVAKPFGLGGLRVGWLVTRSALVRERAARLRDYTTLSVPTLSDALARVALAHAPALLDGTVSLARANLAALAALAASDHVLAPPRPRAGLTAFVGVPDADRVQRRLADAGVLVVPGRLFGHPDRLRIGLAVRSDAFALALDRLADALEA